MTKHPPSTGEKREITIAGKVKRKLLKHWDRLNGYDWVTHERAEVNGLDRRYVSNSSPSGNAYLRRLCESLDITSNDSIMDVGCARGSAMRMFCKFPFKRIGGIEIAEKVAAICEANFKKFGDDRVVVFCVDATKFDQYGDYNYFYLYNPFPTRELVSTFINEICRQCSGTVTIIYNTPMSVDLFYDKGFEKIGEYEDEWDNGMFVLKGTV